LRFKYIPLARICTLTPKTVAFGVDRVEKTEVRGDTLTAHIRAFRMCCTEEGWRKKV